MTEARVLTLPAKPTIRRSLAQGLLSCTEFKPESSEAASLGAVKHDSFQRYLLSCLAHREETRLEDVDQLARDAFYGQARGLAPQRLDEVRDALLRFAQTHPANLAELMHVEHTLTYDAGFCLLTGTADRWDRIDGGDPDDPPTELRLIDFKTQWAPEDFTFQFHFYDALAFLNPEWAALQTITNEAHYIQPGQVSGPVPHTDPETVEREWILAWFEDVLYGLRRRLDGPQGIPTGGAACQYCAKRMRCGAALTAATAIPETESQAEEMFQDLIRLEHAHDETRKGLSAYFNQRAPVLWQGFELGYLPPREPHWRPSDPQAVKRFLDDKGLDGQLALVTTVDAKKIPPYLQQELADAGIASYEMGAAAFKYRKAQEGKVPVPRRPTVVPPPSSLEPPESASSPAVSLASPSTEPESAGSAAAAPARVSSPSSLDPGVPEAPGPSLSPGSKAGAP